MRGINIIRTKGLERELRRIADYLELIVREQGLLVDPAKEEDEAGVTYADREKEAVDEWQRANGLGRDEEEDTE